MLRFLFSQDKDENWVITANRRAWWKSIPPIATNKLIANFAFIVTRYGHNVTRAI
ncbi:hypothetical protein ACFLRM_05030 [Acidobacteriota bacterium]